MYVERSLMPSNTVPRSCELLAATDLRDRERRTAAALENDEIRPGGARHDHNMFSRDAREDFKLLSERTILPH